jgi:hypothetical protein
MTTKDENTILTENDVRRIADEQIKLSIKTVRYFLYGLLGFFIIGFGSGIILGLEQK